jgi:hypothetical protein
MGVTLRLLDRSNVPRSKPCGSGISLGVLEGSRTSKTFTPFLVPIGGPTVTPVAAGGFSWQAMK